MSLQDFLNGSSVCYRNFSETVDLRASYVRDTYSGLMVLMIEQDLGHRWKKIKSFAAGENEVENFFNNLELTA